MAQGSSVAAKTQKPEQKMKTGLKLQQRKTEGTGRALNSIYSPRQRKRGAPAPTEALYSRSVYTSRNHRVPVRAGRRSVRLPDHRRAGVLRMGTGCTGHMRKARRRLGTGRLTPTGEWGFATSTPGGRFRLAIVGVELGPRLC